MFNRARLKLTFWYLLIITLISVSFSFVIYRVQVNEVERFAAAQRSRIEHRLFVLDPNGNPVPIPLPSDFDTQLVEEAEHRIGLNLIIINLAILAAAGYLSYFLAERTLNPIKEMMDEQRQFISDASHELRTPLTSLKTALEVSLRDKSITLKEARSLFRDNLADVDKLQALSDSLLKLARYENPQYSQNLQSLPLLDLIRRSVRRVEPMAKLKCINIVSQSPVINVEVNPDSFVDLLVILLDNAIKYSGDNKSVALTAAKSDGSFTISVSDQGIGIDKKDLPHIFDRFYRTDTARTSAPSGGYGLGLAIAKKIVDRHHGSISVKSQPNKGTTFLLKFPMLQKKPAIKSFSLTSAINSKLRH